MLYKVIDPNFILSDIYREWPFETKVTYTVVCALANNRTGEFYHSIETIAHHANVCQRAVQRSLRRMEDAGVITRLERPGNTTLYKYNFPANIRKRDDSPAGGDSPVGGGVTEQSSQGRLHSHPTESYNDPQSLIESTFTGTIAEANKQDLNKEDLTTLYGDELITELISRYGEKKVIENAVAVLSLENVENKGAYLRASLKGNYVPTNKRRKEEEAKIRQLEYEKRMSEQLNEWKQHVERVKQEADDPEVQAKVRAEIEKMNRMVSIYEEGSKIDTS